MGKRGGERQYWRYTPNPGFSGTDQATFLVDVQGIPVRVVTVLKVMPDTLDDIEMSKVCKGYWVISQSDINSDILDFAFSDLSGSTLAQTTGTGPAARITLDTDAAGHGWYIDYTPCLNEEYLPTSNPHERMAVPYAVLMPAVLFGEALQWSCLYRR
jgi:hypothetical protein